MKHIFIVNPTSGKGNSKNFVNSIQRYFEEHPQLEYEIIYTEYPKHATKIAQGYQKEDDVVLYSVGGDGTASEILDGINEGVTMSVLPAGSGNDFFKSIGQSKKVDYYNMIAKVVEGDNVLIDYGVVDGKKKFINVVSYGLDADINAYANNHVKTETNIPNSLIYAYAASKIAFNPIIYNVEVDVDGKKFNEESILVSFANGKYYGGMFMPAPDALLDDGLLNISIIKKPATTLRLLYLVALYFKGKHTNAKEVISVKGKNIKLKFNQKVNIQADGEELSGSQSEIVLYPKALSYRMPRK